MSERPSLSLIVLAYNEEENIGVVLEELFEWLDQNEPLAEVWVIDDGSTDATHSQAVTAMAGRRGGVIRHTLNRGMGAGIKTGVRAATGAWVTFLPADGQIPPSAIGALRAAAGDDVDIVLSTYDDRDDGPVRALLSWGVRALITVVHGVRIRSEGPYLFRRALLDPEQIHADTFFLNFEVPIRAKRAGLRLRQTTISCRPRRAGESKTAHPTIALRVARDLLRLRLRPLPKW